MNRLILITRPDHDNETEYLNAWSAEIIETANLRGIDIIDAESTKANKKFVTSVIEKKQPKMIFFNGHGDEKIICGFDDENLIVMGHNEHLLESRIVYALSCKSASKLGRCFDGSKTTAFIGYLEDFVFVYDIHKMSKPLEDELAKPFFDASNQIPKSLMSGNTVYDSCERHKDVLKKWIARFRKRRDVEAPWVVSCLVDNFIHQKIYGNHNLLF